MFFFLSKILYYILMPVVWVLFFLLLALFLRDHKWKKRSLISGIILFLIFTNSFIVNEALLLWEKPAKPIEDLGTYEVAVVLTGITSVNREPHDRVYFSKGADRITHALQLYKLGKVKKILISGGTSKVEGEGLREADLLREILLLAEVPDKDIIIENKSRNTYENAVFTAETLEKNGYSDTKVLLITSAFHMRRSAGCFEKQRVKFDTFSTDFYTINRSHYTIDKIVVPQEQPFFYSYVLVHELLGYVVYYVVGYI